MKDATIKAADKALAQIRRAEATYERRDLKLRETRDGAVREILASLSNGVLDVIRAADPAVVDTYWAQDDSTEEL